MKESEIKTWMEDHTFFVAWWKEHRESGFCEDSEGFWHWGSEPWVAYQCDRIRAEYSGDTGTRYFPRNQFTSEEIERWAQDQAIAVKAGQVVTRDQFLARLRHSMAEMARKSAASLVLVKNDQRQLSEAEKFAMINRANKQEALK